MIMCIIYIYYLDVDECATNRDDCDRKTTICENVDGSYVCSCKPGYKPLDELRCEGREYKSVEIDR